MRKTRRFGDTAGNSSSVEIGVNPAGNYTRRIMHRKELSHKLSQGARSQGSKLAGAGSPVHLNNFTRKTCPRALASCRSSGFPERNARMGGIEEATQLPPIRIAEG
ncbi:hypothetical protein [Mesorhizobium kowhaii]|uniref:hypothetical protein n=1 Tax=Mesorhizobium kowhaii TaxID=1300272 RepID=UPI00142E7343|nr:hypothetical protein [Mesorhizobium kowhaii]